MSMSEPASISIQVQPSPPPTGTSPGPVQHRPNPLRISDTEGLPPTAAASSSSSQPPATRLRGYYYWSRWPARNQPFALCGYVVLLSRDRSMLVLNVLLQLLVAGLFLGGVAHYVHWAVFAVGVVLTVMTLSSLALVTFTEPGILPRRSLSSYPPPPHPGSPVPGHNGPVYPNPTAMMDGYAVPLKWCHTCNIYRPLRASHCSSCDCCVEEFDHHCPWVGNCIGKRNYRLFVAFLALILFTDFYILFFSVFLLGWETDRHYASSFADAVDAYPVAMVSALFSFLFFFFLSSLFCYHAFLMINNITTNQHIKQKRQKQGEEQVGVDEPIPPLPFAASAPQMPSPDMEPPFSPSHSQSMPQAVQNVSSSSSSDAASYEEDEDPYAHRSRCYRVFCAPIPPSKFDLNAWIDEEEEEARRGQEMAVVTRHHQQGAEMTQWGQQQQAYPSRLPMPHTHERHPNRAQTAFAAPSVRMVQPVALSSHQQQSVYATAAPSSPYLPSLSPHTVQQPALRPHAAPLLPSLQNTSSPTASVAATGLALSGPLPLTPSSPHAFPPPSQVAHVHNSSLLQQTRAQTQQVEREMQLLQGDKV